jgi:uncharacterized protein YkwD
MNRYVIGWTTLLWALWSIEADANPTPPGLLDVRKQPWEKIECLQQHSAIHQEQIAHTLQLDSIPDTFPNSQRRVKLEEINVHLEAFDRLKDYINPESLHQHVILLITQDINTIRANHWLDSLSLDPTLNHAALQHAHYLNHYKKVSHLWHNKTTPSQRAKQAWYPEQKRIGENIWSGYFTIQQATLRREQSPPHHANMINPIFTKIGVWQAGNKRVVMFGE